MNFDKKPNQPNGEFRYILKKLLNNNDKIVRWMPKLEWHRKDFSDK